MADHGKTELWKMDAKELLRGYAARQFSPVEVAQDLFDRIGRMDGKLHAFLALNTDAAMEAARAAEKAWMSSAAWPALCGVPVTVKDSIEMAGMPTTYGSLAFKDNMRPDAELVRRLKTAGAVILGKTNTPEFALHSQTRNRLGPSTANPWNLAHTAGGSSGGAASAVAAGLGPIAIGTDSAGSIRLPAAYQGVFGFKPTFQRIPAVQDWRASPARSHNGPITRTVVDSALLMQAIAGPDTRDAGSLRFAAADYLSYGEPLAKRTRVAVSRDLGQNLSLDAVQETMLAQAAELARTLGCVVESADPPAMTEGDQIAPGVWAYSGDHYFAAETLCPDFWALHADDLTDYARPIYEAGQRALAWQYRGILQRNTAYATRMQEWFAGYDYLITPCCGPAPVLADGEVRDDRRGQFGLLSPFNLTGNPAAAVPFGTSADGLPVSIQIVGRCGDDVGVLRLSALIEANRPWSHRWPEFAKHPSA